MPGHTPPPKLFSADKAFHFNMQHNSRAVAALGLDPNVDTRLSIGDKLFQQAILYGGNPQQLGWGLHALQDFFAHGNKGVPGIDPNYGNRDGLFALAGISGHLSGTGDNLDNPNYAWDDCRLISANNNVGAANNPTTISQGLASQGYMASWNFESGRK